MCCNVDNSVSGNYNGVVLSLGGGDTSHKFFVALKDTVCNYPKDLPGYPDDLMFYADRDGFAPTFGTIVR